MAVSSGDDINTMIQQRSVVYKQFNHSTLVSRSEQQPRVRSRTEPIDSELPTYQSNCSSPAMASFFSFGSQPVDVEIKLAGEEERRQVEVKGEKDKKEMCPVFYDGESVIGQVNVRVKDGKKFQHDGIRIELIGSIGESQSVCH